MKKTKPITAADFDLVSLHGRRMAVSAITGSITFGLGTPYINHFLWPEGEDSAIFPCALVEKVLKLPWAERWAIAGELCRSLSVEEAHLNAKFPAGVGSTHGNSPRNLPRNMNDKYSTDRIDCQCSIHAIASTQNPRYNAQDPYSGKVGGMS